MKHKFSIYLYWFFAILPFAVSSAFYSRLPERIAIHWDLEGNANGYATKLFGLFGTPAIMLGCIVLINVMLVIDPRRQNINRSGRMKLLVRWFPVVLSNAMDLLLILSALNVRFNMTTVTMVLVGICIALIGNYLPKCKYNYTMGIRVPWTLESEDNWRKTHRFAGRCWILGGVLLVVSGFFPEGWIAFAVLIILSVFPIVYSYLLYAKSNKGKN